MAVKAGEPARILEIRVGLTNADRRFCSRAKTAGVLRQLLISGSKGLTGGALQYIFPTTPVLRRGVGPAIMNR